MNGVESVYSCTPCRTIADDDFDFLKSVCTLGRVIGVLKAPFTVGIYGAWGQGKTSYMEMLKLHLESIDSTGDYVCIWFNAWKYENEDSIILPLLSKLSEHCENNPQLVSSIKKCATATMLTSADIFLKTITLGNFGIEEIEVNLEKAEQAISDSYDHYVSNCDRFEDEYRKLINNISSHGEKKVVVFIDDLDRCSPENVTRLFESIKNYLSLEGCHCLYVIGVDKAVLINGIKVKYEKAEINGADYLEKIINFSVQLPTVSNNNIAEFIRNTFKNQLSQQAYQEREEIINIISDELASYEIFNPRKLKLVITRLLIYLSDLAEARKYLTGIIVYITLVRQLYPSFYYYKKERNVINTGRLAISISANQTKRITEMSYSEAVDAWGTEITDLFYGKNDVKISQVQSPECFWLASRLNKDWASILGENYNGRSIDILKIKKFQKDGLNLGIARYFAKVDALFTL